ncbi:MAG: CHAD domain-containing protein [Caldilineaceae bacterium]|nr:CHAD domain-containing protein [Caldilineaceae bacterium]
MMIPSQPRNHAPQRGQTYTIATAEAYHKLLAATDPAPTTEDVKPSAAVPASAHAPPASAIVEHYVDTADCFLLRTGYTLVIREAGEELFLTLVNQVPRLRGKVASTRRKQWAVAGTVPTWKGALHPDHWPKALAAAQKRLPPKSKLQPLARLRRVSHECALDLAQAPPALLRIDAIAILPVTTHPTRPCAAEAPPLTTLYEVTVLPPQGKKRLPSTQEKAILRALQAIVPVMPQQESSLSRALQCMSTHPTLFHTAHPSSALGADERSSTNGDEFNRETAIQPTMLVTAACRLSWQQQLFAMLRNEAGVRYSRDIEYVHEMRVAIRRARAAFKLYGDFFPRKVLRPYRKMLQRTGRRLGAVRDLDVMLAKAKQAKKQKKETTAQSALLATWEAQRAAAHQELLTWLDSAAYRTFVADFQAFCRTAQPTHLAQGKPGAAPPLVEVRHVVPSLLMARFANVRRYESLFAGSASVSHETIHALRIDCKYLRYSLEFVRHLLGAEGEALIQHLKQLQDLLGDLNDAAVALARLRADCGEAVQGGKAKGNKGGEEATAATAYFQQQQALLNRLTQEVPVALAHFVAHATRQDLALAIAHL